MEGQNKIETVRRWNRREALRLGVGTSVAALLALSNEELLRNVGSTVGGPVGKSLTNVGVAHAQSSNSASTVNFGLALQYDNGVQTDIALNANNVLVEVHKSEGNSGMWYRVGYANRASVNWGGSNKYDDGQTPSVALNDSGKVVEVHKTNSWFSNGLWYRVGQVNGYAINFGGSVQYDSGSNPAVALNNGGKVVEVHKSQSNSGLWYKVGTVSGNNISFGGSVNYDSGYNPAVALNNNNVVVEVHEASSGNNLYYRVGTISGNSISFGPSTQYDTGKDPSVALTDDGFVVEVHKSEGAGTLWQRVGRVVGNTIQWNGGSSYFDDGQAPSVASNARLAVQTHQSQTFATLWYSTSLIVDRAAWMQNALPQIGNKTLKQLALPASHDAGMYLGSFPASLGRTQDLDLYGQLKAGIRYFDLRPRWTNNTLVIQHTVDGPPVQDVLNSVRGFMLEGRREVVILKFSHYDAFDSTAYNQLVQMINNTVGNWLFTLPAGKRLSEVTMNEFVGNSGKVIVVCDGDYPRNQPSSGIFVYRDWESGDPQNGDLRVFDRYSNTTDYNTMKNDQFSKFNSYNGLCQNGSTPCDLFLLSWTLTPITDVYNVSKPANAALGSAVNELTIPNGSGQIVNLVYVDYVQYARATDVCLFLNNIAP